MRHGRFKIMVEGEIQPLEKVEPKQFLFLHFSHLEKEAKNSVFREHRTKCAIRLRS